MFSISARVQLKLLLILYMVSVVDERVHFMKKILRLQPRRQDVNYYYIAQRVIEEVYGDCVCETKYGKVRCNAEYIYGDTDSVFFTFHLKELDGTPIVGKKGLELTIELAQEAGQLASKFLKPPHDLEYEKTILSVSPFIEEAICGTFI